METTFAPSSQCDTNKRRKEVSYFPILLSNLVHWRYDRQQKFQGFEELVCDIWSDNNEAKG